FLSTAIPASSLFPLSLHDALPILLFDLDAPALIFGQMPVKTVHLVMRHEINVFLYEFNREHVPSDIEMHPAVGEARVIVNGYYRDRKSTRLNSSHVKISYAVFCLK